MANAACPETNSCCTWPSSQRVTRHGRDVVLVDGVLQPRQGRYVARGIDVARPEPAAEGGFHGHEGGDGTFVLPALEGQSLLELLWSFCIAALASATTCAGLVGGVLYQVGPVVQALGVVEPRDGVDTALIGTSGSPVLCEMRGAGDLLWQQPAGEHLFRPGREVLTHDRAPAGSPGGWTADGVACPALAVSTDPLGRWRFSLMLPDVTRRDGRMRVAVHR